MKIAVRDEKEFVIVTVEDDGVGIDEATCSKLFEDSIGESGSVALKNIQLRLIRLYGHGLDIERKATGGDENNYTNYKIKKASIKYLKIFFCFNIERFF